MKGQRALRRIVGLGILLLMLVLAGSTALLAFAAHSVDELQAREERMLVTRTMERFQERIIGDITTATVWDQAYEKLRPGGDVAWADSEIGSYFANNRGHDVTVVLDQHDQPFYSWAGPARTAPNAHAAFRQAVQPLVARVRRQEKAGKAHEAGLGATAPGLSQTAGGLVAAGGAYYLVGISSVVRESADAPQQPGPAVLVVSARKVDDLLAQLVRELQVSEAEITMVPEPGENRIPLIDVNGVEVSGIDWHPKLPGLQALRNAAPLIALGILLLLGVGAALALYMRDVTRELEAEELGHREAMRQLVAARDRAEQASSAKSHFLANMSHEIRTPLNGILGMVQVMERAGGLAGPNAERLEIIRDAGETLLAVLNGILDLSKIEAGRFELDLQEFDLREMVSAACKPFANLAAQKDLEFEIDIDSEAMGVWRGDPMRLRQILSNLTANAVKFTSEGEIRVEVTRTPKGLRFAVTDTGIGIPADRVAELFEKFVQADSSMSRRFGGTGLGLAICREFVNIMGGRLAVQTQEGRGSTFAFELPLPKLKGAVAPRDPLAIPHPDTLPIRVLAAEDSKPNQLVLKALLEPLGVELQIVPDGAEAVKVFRRGVFDLVLMDIQMPTMNGIDAALAIRALETGKGRDRTPILALSANVMSHQIMEYFAAGMDGYVAKPIDAAVLIDTIRHTLNPADAPAEALA